jgi:adenosylmethionine-8-amino-7-oxononanoate aminotransferase
MGTYRRKTQPLVIERAKGSRLFDADGRSIIDANASWWTCLLGHNHDRLIGALHAQSQQFCHTALAGITHEPAVVLAERLKKRAPAGMNHVFFSDNGSTAVESALKMAVQFWAQQGAQTNQKHCFLSLRGAFHGETLGATAVGDVPAFQAPFSSLLMPVTHLPSPADGEERALELLERELSTRGEKYAALIVEPLIQGAGGMRMYGADFLVQARRLTQQFDCLLIVDEVFTGYGRTGLFWACDHASITPDILCTAKGLSGGVLPMAATLTSSRVFDAFLGSADRAFYYGHTYCGNPLGAAVAAEVLSIYEDEKILEGVIPRQELISSTFAELGRLPHVAGARALGMCAALDLGAEGDYHSRAGWDVYDLALRQGVYLRPLGNVVYIAPALNIPISDLEELLSVVRCCVETVASTFDHR